MINRCANGKTYVNGPFSIAMLNNQRVDSISGGEFQPELHKNK